MLQTLLYNQAYKEKSELTN